MIKIGYVVSYKDPRYVRTRFLESAFTELDNCTLYRAINKQRGVLRYIETLIKLMWMRMTKRPDVYILGFRGFEIFWPVRLLTIGKPLVYDEFLNPHLWLIEEHKKFKKGSFAEKLLRFYSHSVYMASCLILSDTPAHAEYTHETFGIDKEKLLTIYVGADESIFFPCTPTLEEEEKFRVFFYGNFLPLHGVHHIIEAAEILHDNTNIEFFIAGGAHRSKDEDSITQSIREKNLTNIEHVSWLSLEEIRSRIDTADLCLGGPFGDTPQSHKVITGKTFQFIACQAATVVGATEVDSGFIDKKNALLIRQGSGTELADAITWAHEHKQELPEIATQGRKLYEEQFSASVQKEKLYNAIAQIASQS